MDVERLERAARVAFEEWMRREGPSYDCSEEALFATFFDGYRAALAAPGPAPATGDAHTWERPSRVWVVAWPNARSAHFTEEARDHAAEPMPNGSAPVVTEYVPAAHAPAQADPWAWAVLLPGNTPQQARIRMTEREATSCAAELPGFAIVPLYAAPSRPGGAA